MWVRTLDDLGQVIRDRRKRLGWSQLKLAELVGVSRPWVISLEKGRPGADVARVLKAMAVMGLKLDVRQPAQPAEPRGSMHFDAAAGADQQGEPPPRRLATNRAWGDASRQERSSGPETGSRRTEPNP